VAYQGLEERVDRLEILVATFVQHTDATIAELRQGQTELRRSQTESSTELHRSLEESNAELRRHLAESNAELRRHLAESNAETRLCLEQGQAEPRRNLEQSNAEWRRRSEEFHRNMESFKERVDQDLAGMEQWRRQSQKQWGELAQKLGTVVEDIVAPNIPRSGKEVFALGDPPEDLFSAARLRISHSQDRARMREFDYIYATRKGWVVVESKNDPKLKDIDDFREMLAEIKEYFPQYASRPLYPVFASLGLPDHGVKYCTRRHIYALGMGPETMQLLNRAELASESNPAH
jgi:hypothetical protein